MFNNPVKVNAETLNRVFEHGVFNNLVDWGWQEAYFLTSNELVSLFSSNGFSKVLLRSVRGWEERIYQLKDENLEKYKTVMDLINKTADDSSIVEMCSHAIYVGRKQ